MWFSKPNVNRLAIRELTVDVGSGIQPVKSILKCNPGRQNFAFELSLSLGVGGLAVAANLQE